MANSSPPSEPLEIDSIMSRGGVLARSPIVEIYVRNQAGGILRYEWPDESPKKLPVTTEELPLYLQRWCDKIMKFLSGCSNPVRTCDIQDAINDGDKGSDFGKALAHLRRIGEVTTIKGRNADDPNKFELDQK